MTEEKNTNTWAATLEELSDPVKATMSGHYAVAALLSQIDNLDFANRRVSDELDENRKTYFDLRAQRIEISQRRSQLEDAIDRLAPSDS